MQQRFYKNYLLTLLMVILAFNYVDRLALGVVLEDIKTDLSLSDTQLGLLGGIAFALFYSLMGIPIARWADRGNRITIIVTTTFLWSAAVALCGVAGSFLQLLLIRVGVAVGEAGCVPPAHSLIADHFTRAERPRAVARYMLGAPVALIVGYFAAGWINELYGWRTTFFVLGVPGIVIALLTLFTLREPRLQRSPAQRLAADAEMAQLSTREVMTRLWSIPTFRHLLLCFSVWYFFGYGLLQWQPTFFIRSHGLQTGELGGWLALVYGVGGLVGTYLGGEWATRYAANNERAQLIAMGALFSIFAIFSLAAYLAPTHQLAFGALMVAAVGGALTNGPLLATIQTLVPAPMRAMSIAIVYLFANFIGMGLGPLAAGALSDALRPWYGEESLRYALMVFSPGYLWAAWHLWRASRTIHRDLDRVQPDGAASSEQALTAAVPAGRARVSPAGSNVAGQFGHASK